ncbi:MAG TPA: c-type cytochrome, partial [Gemmatimonadaceae bacterium]|nr:c-type cytochrome [Gemmatimonadaceae bacterium]
MTVASHIRLGYLISVSLLMVGGCEVQERKDVAAETATTVAATKATPQATPPRTAAFRVPDESEITDTAFLRSVRRGRALMVATRDSLPAHVGNALRCTSCHMNDGLKANAMPFVGVYAQFPQYRSRSGKVIEMEDRINDCFERSMNGRPLARDGRDMIDIISYMSFLSYGVPVGARVEGQGIPRLQPMDGDSARGAQVYAQSCVVCHGANGEGTAAAPPVWGPRSYNIAAGMARVRTAAAFIKQAMPFDRPGSLTDQQAFDVAAYVNSQSRPDYRGKEKDWPHGDPPPDVAYPTDA